jgi:hypothetical protein
MSKTACKQCGAESSSGQCPDCRYRRGGKLTDQQPHEQDLVDQVLRHSQKHFRDGFTADQLSQVSPSER